MIYTVQKCFDNYSFEELRFASPALQRQSENMLVRANNDGTFSANWTPGNIGGYKIHVTIDGCEMAETFKVRKIRKSTNCSRTEKPIFYYVFPFT